MEGTKHCRGLGQTRDDAVGEAFDKVAKLMSRGFPGGPEIERAALKGNPRAFRFTVPKIRGGSPYDFSFSGIKTAVLHKIREWENEGRGEGDRFRADLAASFQSSVVEEVVMKAVGACQEHRVARLVVGGGVIANGRLRGRLAEVAGDFKIDLALPEVAWSTDNGVMVAGLGAHLEERLLSQLTVVPDLSVEMN
jgi:N6-L-threonylcarbamoyladenine synthase